jgi:hypothetical protein
MWLGCFSTQPEIATMCWESARCGLPSQNQGFLNIQGHKNFAQLVLSAIRSAVPAPDITIPTQGARLRMQVAPAQRYAKQGGQAGQAQRPTHRLV